MTLFFQYMQQNPAVFQAVVFLLGLIIGSFLNVVIYRYPVMLKHQWHQMSVDYLEESGFKLKNPNSVGPMEEKLQKESAIKESEVDSEPFNFAVPASSCPNCNHKIRIWENIPIISYLLLRGKCSHCKAHISLRYPLVELLTGLAFYTVATFSVPGIVSIFLARLYLG